MATPDYLAYLGSPAFLRRKRMAPKDAAVLASFVDPEEAKRYTETAIRGARGKARKVAQESTLALGERKIGEEIPLQLKSAQLRGEMGTAQTAAQKAELSQKLELGLREQKGEFARRTSRAKSGHELALARLRASKGTGSSTWPNILAAASIPISFASGYAGIKEAQKTADWNRWYSSLYT